LRPLTRTVELPTPAERTGLPAFTCNGLTARARVFLAAFAFLTLTATALSGQSARISCGRCHADREFLAGRGANAEADEALFVSDSMLIDSRHDTLSCNSCHLNYNEVYPHQSSASTVDCESCHTEVGEDWARSVHAANLAVDGEGPSCIRCHTEHRVLGEDDRRSPIHPLNEARLCASCHDDARIVETYFADPADSIARTAVDRYSETVHGLALEQSGLTVTATCSDCHGPHRVLPSDSTGSTIYRDSIPATCGACHEGILEVYNSSAHGVALREGKEPEDEHEAPACNECHSAHGVAPTDEVWKSDVVEECGACHEHLYETYFDTYHGKVTRLGSSLAAKCSDCHTPHAMLPPDDSASSVHRVNLIETCGECHEEASPRFTMYHPHGDHSDRERFPEMYWPWLMMTSLLIGTFAFFGLHTFLWLIRSMIEARSMSGRPVPQAGQADPQPEAGTEPTASPDPRERT
jgi:nitrate/TMAO reductase-like tetraheme cytochrome c subunit